MTKVEKQLLHATTRTEKDFLGETELPDSAYYGVQTLRGKESFRRTNVDRERNLLTQEKWDEVFSFENLVSPKFEQ